MPKIVNHDERRQELIEATWQVIAQHGLSAVTMRQIAEEAGYANGALKPYFPTKSAETVDFHTPSPPAIFYLHWEKVI